MNAVTTAATAAACLVQAVGRTERIHTEILKALLYSSRSTSRGTVPPSKTKGEIRRGPGINAVAVNAVSHYLYSGTRDLFNKLLKPGAL